MFTQTVKDILGMRPYDGKNGRVFYYKLEMADGTIGEIGKKKENAFKPGDSLTYTVEDSEYGKKFKEVQANGGNGFNGNGNGGFKKSPPANTASFALSYSKDIMLKKLESDPTMSADKIVDATLWIANKFHDWLKEKE